MTTFHFTGEQPLAHVEWTVYQIEGREAVSELFHFAVVVGADLHAVEAAISGEEPLQPEARARDQTPDQRTIETAAIQQPVAFAFTREDTTERFGIVAAATVLGVVASRTTGATMVVVRFDVAPRAWVTHHRRRSRVFQNLRMHQIVSRVLAEMNVSHRWVLQKNYPKRVYAVQYDETDWAFVTRLLAEEGVFFFFEHGPFEREDEPPEGEETWRQVRRGARLAGQGLNALGSVPVIGPYARGGAAAANALAGEEDPVEEEEDPAQIAPGSGSGGPATEAGDVLVFVDQPESYLAKLRRGTAEPPDGPAPELRLDLRSADGMVSDLGALRLFVPRRTIRPLRTHVRDYEFKNPLFELSARASTLPRAEAPPSPDLEVYHHHGEYERPDVNDENAGLHLEQHRADAAVALGEGRHPDLGAGVRFRLENHSEPRVPVPEGRFAAARVWHRFAQPDIETAVGELLRFVAAFEGVEGLFPAATRDAAHEAMAPSEAWTYANRFECVRDTTAFRPPRPRRAPRTSIELATVVGPIGEEVYTDKHGRIKVQFHWDREGKWLPESSCWVRVAQTWGGAGFGSMFIPRVGMEVVVAFVGGDPDRPVVVGTLYNGTHPTAEPLPAKKTRSGFTTQISPGGGGGNELSFEDAREHAEVRLRAHKDLNVQVGDTHSTTVTGDAVKLVGGDDHVGVQGDRVVGVGGSRASLVSAVDALVVGGDRSTRVAGNALASVGGDAVAQVDGNAVRTTDHDALEHVAGDRTVRTDGNTITHVGGHALDGDAQAVTFVEGSWRLHATRTIEVHADAGGHHDDARLVLRCGNSSIVMSPESIEIRSTVVRINGREILELHGERSAMQLDDQGIRGQGRMVDFRTLDGAAMLHLSSTEAIVRHRNCTRLRGRDIHLETPSVGSIGSPTEDPLPQLPEPNVVLQFTDETLSRQGTALPVGSKWRVVAAGDDDFTTEGALGEQGLLQVYIPDAVKVIDVFIWPEGLEHAYPPEHGPLQWKVHLRDDLGEIGEPDAPATLEAARVRLRNLGYLPAADVARAELDALTAAAVRRFRQDYRLEPAEEDDPLDAATLDKLREVYGA